MRRMCKYRLVLPGLPADNPQQSEEASHIGPSGNCKCHRCFVGGPAGLRESDDGYMALHQVSHNTARCHWDPSLKSSPSACEPHTVETTVSEIRNQLNRAAEGALAPVLKMQTASGTKDRVMQAWILKVVAKAKEIRKSNPHWTSTHVQSQAKEWLNEQTTEPWSPLLSIRGLDPYRDTPVELLHTVLLGSVKYVWHNLHMTLTDQERDLFVTRLDSTSINGLSVPPIRAGYMSQYRNSLVGKHFKVLMQTATFHVHGLVSEAQFKLIKTVGQVGALMWYHSTPDMTTYIADLRMLIQNVLHAFDLVDPARIIDKGKLLFSHTCLMTYNILDQRSAPGHDIARKCASMEQLKHILSSGYWHCEDGTWGQASRQVHAVIKQQRAVQTHLGWVPPVKDVSGNLKPIAANKCDIHQWDQMFLAKTHFLNPHPPPESEWYEGISVISQSNDTCPCHSWVCSDTQLGKSILGCIHRILLPTEKSQSNVIILENFTLSDTLHPHYDMPFLTRPDPPTYTFIKPMDVKFIFNVQHDCQMSNCQPNGVRVLHQEREQTTWTAQVLTHVNNSRFIINLHALHNAAPLQSALPRHLTAPKPLFPNAMAFCHETAAKLRIVTQGEKRKATRTRAHATREANKLKKATQCASTMPLDTPH
ncbi:hypothetical protein JB92DRAFT_3103859 [Gautieria morchelliformis]|nr:hypothetical protein JB92DRAFT_3103859 [Gautieria morchelliformis]